ncbi:MAG TPA: LD-carboxypeptidase, partial [Chroococcales cyanobacterium]
MMTKSLTRPKCLKAGDLVGVVAPSSPPFESGQLAFSLGWLQKLGLRAKISDQVLSRQGDFAGSDRERLEALHSMWADPEVAAVIAVRGGNGCARLLSHVDYSLFEKQPKILIGFSDISALLVAVHQQTGLVTFHGPTFGAFFQSAYTFSWFSRVLFDCSAIGDISDPADLSDLGPPYPPARLVIAPGSARGQLTGGNLTTLKELMGTPFEIDTRG